MHDAAYAFVERFGTDKPVKVLEFGGLDINGTVRDLFPNAHYTSVDLVSGPGVDVKADCTLYEHPQKVDVVVCCEVLEHCAEWEHIIGNAAENLKSGGRLIVTAAGPTRPPHSGVDGGTLRDGEWYRNIQRDALEDCLSWHFKEYEVDVLDDDVRAVAKK